MISRAAAILLALVAFGGSARAEDVFTQRNAATWYLRAIDEFDRLSEAQWETLGAYDADPAQPPPPEIRDIVQRGAKIIDLVQRGATRDDADFGLDYSQGAELLLPHLGQLRNAARLMRADAITRLHDGDAPGAARIVASMYRVAAHVSNDHIIISSLVGMAIYRMTDELARAAFDRASFDAADSAALLRGLRPLGRPDPFDIGEAVAMEQEVMVDWIAQRYQGENAMAEFLEFVGTFDDDLGPLADPAVAATANLEEHLAQFDDAMTEIVEAFMEPDRAAGRARLEELEKEVLAGEFGLVAGLMTPTLVRVHDRLVDSESEVNARIAMLEAIVTGALDPRAERNAAYLYLGAIEQIEALDAEKLAGLRAFDAHPAHAMTDELTALLDEAAPILDLLTEAAHQPRCDFSVVRREEPPALAPAYVPGMRDAFRFVHVDAVRMLRRSDPDAATGRLDTQLRMSAHLGGDGLLASALVAHTGFEQARALASSMHEMGDLGDERRQTLRAAAEQVSRKDPFGYIAGVMDARQAVAAHFERQRAAAEAPAAPWQEAIDATARLNGDQSLFLRVILDTMRRAGRAEEPAGAATADDPLAPLADVISLTALEAARRQVPNVAPRLSKGRLDEVLAMDASAIAQVAIRQRAARSDLRDGLNLLRPRASAEEESASP